MLAEMPSRRKAERRERTSGVAEGDTRFHVEYPAPPERCRGVLFSVRRLLRVHDAARLRTRAALDETP